MDKEKIVAAALKLSRPAAGMEDVVRIVLENAISVKADGSFIIVDKTGNRRYKYSNGRIEDMDIVDYVASLRSESPSLFKSDDEPTNDEPETYAGENPFAKDNMDLHKASELFRQNPVLARRLMAEAKGKPVIGGNPWKRETFNLTEQMRLANVEPEKASRLRQEAGVR